MDYSHAAYFGAQPYQFMGVPPLTPSHSNSAPSEDYNTTSPPELFGDLPNDQFQNFEQYAHFNTAQQQQQPGFPKPPTPPNQQLPAVQQQQQPALNGNGSAPSLSLKVSPPVVDGLPSAKIPESAIERAGSNSDDEDLTPAQSRRKAQNRAAQRAFRERKERHVKDLEAKLASLEATQHETATENERLKRDLQKVSTENEILRATSSMTAGGSPGSHHQGGFATTTGPLTYSPTDFYDDLLQNHDNKTPSHRVAFSENGQRLLGAGAAWDMIIGHDLFRRGRVDIADVSNRLKTQAKCDGQGPVFEECAVMAAIEQSVASGSDELI